MSDKEELVKKIKGMVTVQFCPYKENGDLDLEGLRANTEFLVKFSKGKDVIILTNGSTTEAYANSIEEQKQVIKTVVDTVGGKLPVIAGVSQPGGRETIKLAKYAKDAGADFAMVVLPYYHKASREGMYNYYKEIAESVDIPLVIYNNPDVSASLIDVDLMIKFSELKNIVAIKDNSPNFFEYFWKSVRVDHSKLALLAGHGELQYVAANSFGFNYTGYVTSIANFAPSLSYQIYEAVNNRDFNKAFDGLKKIVPILNLYDKYKKRRGSLSVLPSIYEANLMYIPVGKAAMDFVGLRGGPTRSPLDNLTAEEKEEVWQVTKSLGLNQGKPRFFGRPIFDFRGGNLLRATPHQKL
ncbi:MAG: dihydrodipicolinate synthase family protein [Thermoprotei archaeon]